MATITDRRLIDQLIADDGWYEDDPQAALIVEYVNFEGGVTWGVTWTHETPERQRRHPPANRVCALAAGALAARRRRAVSERAAFEAWITLPPIEGSLRRLADTDTLRRLTDAASWPGQYADYPTQLAWEAWQAALAWQGQRDGASGPPSR